MVGIDASTVKLAEITRREVKRYAGYSPTAKVYALLDDERQVYAVIVVEDTPKPRDVWIVVMARVVDDKVVIEEDRTLDKPLVDALMHNAGIPREQIVLAYAGEKPPESTQSE